MKKGLILALMFLMTLVATPALQAVPITTVTYDFTSNHITNSTDTGPFGTVTLTQDGSNVDFSVSLNDAQFIRTGAGGGSNFVFNAIGVALGDISGAGLTAIDREINPANNNLGAPPIHTGGAGDFDFGVYFTGQGGGGVNALDGPIEFTVNNATIAELTEPNSSGNIFAADIILGSSYTGSGLTGVVDVEGPPTVPEPTTLLLLGLGVLGLAGMGRKLKNR